MDRIILTPRLKLVSILKAEKGSRELEWLHAVRSDEKATWWSIFGRSKTMEDTERITKCALPGDDQGTGSWRVTYAVHKLLDDDNPSRQAPFTEAETETEIIGLVSILSLGPKALDLPTHLTFSPSPTPTLTVELGYCFLPTSWNKGYATESVKAVLECCKRSWGFWKPYQRVWIRAIVQIDNQASKGVLRKVGLEEKGVYVWEGKGDEVFVAGKWRTRDELVCFGRMFAMGEE